MPIYKLPQFNTTLDLYQLVSTSPLVTTLLSSGLSCRVYGSPRGDFLVIKCPKATNLRVSDSYLGTHTYIANAPAGSNDYYLISEYIPVAQGYPNEYEMYQVSYVIPPSVLPHSTF